MFSNMEPDPNLFHDIEFMLPFQYVYICISFTFPYTDLCIPNDLSAYRASARDLKLKINVKKVCFFYVSFMFTIPNFF